MEYIQLDLFGGHEAMKQFLLHGNPLVELDAHIQWEPLVKIVDKIWTEAREGTTGRGPKPWSSEVMLRVLILKRLYSLSIDQMEYQLRDRLSFRHFLKLGLLDEVPDSRTIWSYENQLSEKDAAKALFNAFNEQLQSDGLLVKEGTMVDATFVEVPKQRNSKEENEMIKEGKTPDQWKEQPHKLRQKDTDARWTKKNNEKYYGYKNHVKVGRKTKLILAYQTTSASTHDSQAMESLMEQGDGSVHADSAYVGTKIAEDLQRKGIRNHIHEKAYKSTPLTEEQKASNHSKSKVRARVEHVFAFMTNSLGGLFNRCIGALRNHHQIGMLNLCYNICRSIQLATGRAQCA